MAKRAKAAAEGIFGRSFQGLPVIGSSRPPSKHHSGVKLCRSGVMVKSPPFTGGRLPAHHGELWSFRAGLMDHSLRAALNRENSVRTSARLLEVLVRPTRLAS
jgi:hypothetical protein